MKLKRIKLIFYRNTNNKHLASVCEPSYNKLGILNHSLTLQFQLFSRVIKDSTKRKEINFELWGECIENLAERIDAVLFLVKYCGSFTGSLFLGNSSCCHNLQILTGSVDRGICRNVDMGSFSYWSSRDFLITGGRWAATKLALWVIVTTG